MRRREIDKKAEAAGKTVPEYLQELYEKHGSQIGVALQIGVSQSRVSQYLREAGLKEKVVLVKCQN